MRLYKRVLLLVPSTYLQDTSAGGIDDQEDCPTSWLVAVMLVRRLVFLHLHPAHLGIPVACNKVAYYTGGR